MALKKRDPQREKAVGDLISARDREKNANEKIIVSPGLSPTGQQATITRAEFEANQANKQKAQLGKQNTMIALKQALNPSDLPPATPSMLSPSNIPFQPTIVQPQAPNQEKTQDTANIPSTLELLKRAAPDIAANTASRTAVGAGGGAITGGVIGSVVPAAGTALGAGGGAVVGGVGGFVSGLSTTFSELKQEASIEVNVEYKDFTSARTNIKATLRAAKTDPVGAYEVYQAQWAGIDEAEGKFKAFSEKDWLYKARPELTAIQKFRESKALYDTLLIKAMGGEDIIIPEEIAQ